MNRLDRSNYTLEDALNEIGFVEGVLDNMGAKEGLTLWGRVVDARDTHAAELAAVRAALETFKTAYHELWTKHGHLGEKTADEVLAAALAETESTPADGKTADSF
jgi:hypothetical protein